MSDLFIPKRKQPFQVQYRKPDLNKGPQRLTMEEQIKAEKQANLPKQKWKRKSPLNNLSSEERKLYRKPIIQLQLILDSKNIEYSEYDDKLQLIKRMKINNIEA